MIERVDSLIDAGALGQAGDAIARAYLWGKVIDNVAWWLFLVFIIFLCALLVYVARAYAIDEKVKYIKCLESCRLGWPLYKERNGDHSYCMKTEKKQLRELLDD